MSEFCCIIPARLGSKRLSNKNFRDFAGKPLVEWSILLVLMSERIKQIIVSTDNENYKYDHKKVVIDVRPKELAQDTTPIEEVIDYLKDKFVITNPIVLIQPTSPLRCPFDLYNCLLLFDHKKHSVISVNNATYLPNGAFYVFDKKIYQTPMEFYEMLPERSIDIDFEYQFIMAESLFEKLKLKEELV